MTRSVKFEVGQRWLYKTRAEDPKSTVVIGKVENTVEMGTVVHISVLDVNIRSPHEPNGFTHEVHHMPISPWALQVSVTERSGRGAPAAQFEEGYQIWRDAVAAGKAGVFSIPVHKAVGYFEDIINASQ